ncbi:hypothetical protein PsorP6_014511 [Peronosclerospora sorghi]|uniref:Uncharacterized protein n=1 Tax=Peronosclerospora sorghi TaxID=230839 RepID=A0ACC0VSS1_9STRA|nr:hypothetical protein PsorP6_014511 [Peronosclerospora sorghi]
MDDVEARLESSNELVLLWDIGEKRSTHMVSACLRRSHDQSRRVRCNLHTPQLLRAYVEKKVPQFT